MKHACCIAELLCRTLRWLVDFARPESKVNYPLYLTPVSRKITPCLPLSEYSGVIASMGFWQSPPNVVCVASITTLCHEMTSKHSWALTRLRPKTGWGGGYCLAQATFVLSTYKTSSPPCWDLDQSWTVGAYSAV